MVDRQRQSDRRDKRIPILVCSLLVIGYFLTFPIAIEVGILGPITGFFAAFLLITLSSTLKHSKSAADRREPDSTGDPFADSSLAIAQTTIPDHASSEVAFPAAGGELSPDRNLIAFDVQHIIEEAIAWAADRCDTSPDRCRIRIEESSCSFLYGPRNIIAKVLGESVASALSASGNQPIMIEVAPDPDEENRVSYSIIGASPASNADIANIIEVSDELAEAQHLFETSGGSFTVNTDVNEKVLIRFSMVNHVPVAIDGRHRASARFAQDGVTCSLGDVLDISRSGIRIETSRAPRGPVDLTLDDGEMTVELRANPVWSKRLNWRRFEVGLVFVDLNQTAEKRLIKLAMTNRGRLTLGGDSITAAA